MSSHSSSKVNPKVLITIAIYFFAIVASRAMARALELSFGWSNALTVGVVVAVWYILRKTVWKSHNGGGHPTGGHHEGASTFQKVGLGLGGVMLALWVTAQFYSMEMLKGRTAYIPTEPMTVIGQQTFKTGEWTMVAPAGGKFSDRLETPRGYQTTWKSERTPDQNEPVLVVVGKMRVNGQVDESPPRPLKKGESLTILSDTLRFAYTGTNDLIIRVTRYVR